ncbi:rhodanese-like domain-containing protein [Candidatus Marithrix sp. Canyon 246]|uniref:rhodanese-like domain-containing protein n=1 Tax=Candidatus Marithrix sp. Canyon 246 TaxID=1827136 RepID=UPI00084A16DE|nr:rhodanese-like domain-containing protein [Candidatus Marithrix sp. Canyon 246]
MKKYLLFLMFWLSYSAYAAVDTVSFSMKAKTFNIPAVHVEKFGLFDLEFKVLNEEPLEFEIIKATPVMNMVSHLATFSMETGILHIPLVKFTDKDGKTEDVYTDLQVRLKPPLGRFHVTSSVSAKTMAAYELLATKSHSLTDIPSKLAELEKIFDKLISVVEANPDMSVVVGAQDVGKLKTTGKLIPYPAVDFDGDGKADQIGRMLEFSFADDAKFLQEDLAYGVALPWTITAYTTNDTIYVTAAVPQTWVRTYFNGEKNLEPLLKLATGYQKKIEDLVASTLEPLGFKTNLNTPLKGMNLLGKAEIAMMEAQTGEKLTAKYARPFITIKDDLLDPKDVVEKIIKAFLVNNVSDVDGNGTAGEEADEEFLPHAVKEYIGGKKTFEDISKVFDQGMELWKKGGSFANWTLLRTVDLSDGKGGTYHLFELCQEFYSGLALQVGLNHMSALPCSLGVWKDSEGVHINMLTPQFIFSYFFTDMMIDPNNEQQVRTGKLFQVFPTMVYNELAGILNGVIEEVGGKEKFEMIPMKMDSFETVRQHIDTWLATVEDKNLVTDTKVKALIDDWDTNKDKYQIVSVRKPEHYAQGHVANAINIQFANIVDDDSLKLLDPKKTTIAYCYVGQKGQLSMTLLNLVNFKAKNLSGGMMDWNVDTFKEAGKTPWDGVADYPVETKDNNPTETYSTPAIKTKLTKAADIIQEQAQTYLKTIVGMRDHVITTSDVKAIIDDWDNNKDKYQIVSVRDAEDYAKGHIANAINIPWKQALKLENLKKLDPNKTIITYSERGFSGETIGISLNLLGYKVRNIKFGFMDWNLESFEDSGNTPWDQKADNPVEK